MKNKMKFELLSNHVLSMEVLYNFTKETLLQNEIFAHKSLIKCCVEEKGRREIVHVF